MNRLTKSVLDLFDKNNPQKHPYNRAAMQCKMSHKDKRSLCGWAGLSNASQKGQSKVVLTNTNQVSESEKQIDREGGSQLPQRANSLSLLVPPNKLRSPITKGFKDHQPSGSRVLKQSGSI